MIEDCCACGPIPLFQSDVIAGAITLSTPGLNYCLAENITGNIIVNGANVTIDGNDRVLTGRIIIAGNDVIIKNVKIKPLAPINTVDAANAAVSIASDGVTILKCLIECANTAVVLNPAIKGRDCIFVNGGDGVIIKNCNCTAGNGGDAPLANNNAAGGSGGSGITFTNSGNGLIEDTIIIAGNGGTGSSAASAGTGGAGGNGIFILSSFKISVHNIIITAGTGGQGGNSANAGSGGNGGNGIIITVGFMFVIDSCYLTGGSSGSNGIGVVGLQGSGGNGIFILSGADNVQICECKIENFGHTLDDQLLGGDAIRIDSPNIGKPTQNVQIINNKILFIGAIGVHLNGVANSGPNDCQVIGNVIDSLGRDGITVEIGATRTQVTSNRINNAQLIGIRNDASLANAKFANNMVSNSSMSYGGVAMPSNISLLAIPNQNIGYWANVF
jgi:hypothetical protein